MSKKASGQRTRQSHSAAFKVALAALREDKILVCPKLPTASSGSSHVPAAAV